MSHALCALIASALQADLTGLIPGISTDATDKLTSSINFTQLVSAAINQTLSDGATSGNATTGVGTSSNITSNSSAGVSNSSALAALLTPCESGGRLTPSPSSAAVHPNYTTAVRSAASSPLPHMRNPGNLTRLSHFPPGLPHSPISTPAQPCPRRWRRSYLWRWSPACAAWPTA